MVRLFSAIQPAVKRHIHRHKTCHPADRIGDRLRQKHTVHAKPEPGQEHRQRRDDHRFAKQREKNGVARVPQCSERRLPRKLKRHKEEAEKI